MHLANFQEGLGRCQVLGAVPETDNCLETVQIRQGRAFLELGSS